MNGPVVQRALSIRTAQPLTRSLMGVSSSRSSSTSGTRSPTASAPALAFLAAASLGLAGSAAAASSFAAALPVLLRLAAGASAGAASALLVLLRLGAMLPVVWQAGAGWQA